MDYRNPTPTIKESTGAKKSAAAFPAEKIERMKELIRRNSEIEKEFERNFPHGDFLRAREA